MEWMNFLAGNQHATPFQSFSFFRLFNSVEQLTADAFAISENGKIKALAVVTIQKETGLKSLFSRRAIIYGGPLVDETCPQAIDALLNAININLSSWTIYLETRNLSDYSLLKDVFSRNGYEYVPYLNYIVDTGNADLMIQNISKSRLRQIKKAQRQSVKCLEAQNEDEVMLFYLMLKDFYKKKIKKPLPGEDFFINFFRQGLGKYLLVWHEEDLIGGILCPFLPGKVLYEFYICGRDDKFRELYPSAIVTWSALEYASRNNYQCFDFMGAGKPDEQYGVRDFKSRFGGRQVEYGRFLMVRKPVLYYIGKSALQLKRKIFK
ncbi:MAG: peptidoglycan bridge formation glycyltransferase FemA/FemB family protein [Bacteroidales bacterium]|nr:peptidoglycan bridge formation glycyltransferase FemA/FemB family protein [Bacteroidales bacterium]